MNAITNLPTVRIAVPDDRAEIVAMVHNHHTENAIVFKLEGDRINQVLDKHYNKTGGIVGVIGETGSLQACCALVFSDLWYSGDWHICELFNYVKPECRRSHNADALMEFAKECSRRIGLPLIAGVITNHETAEKVRLYRRRYGSPAGAFFVFNAAWEHNPMPDKEFSALFEPRAERRKREKKENGVALAMALATTNATATMMVQ